MKVHIFADGSVGTFPVRAIEHDAGGKNDDRCRTEGGCPPVCE